MKKIATVTPTLFDDFLIISFNKKWIDVWGKIPEFDVFSDGKTLKITSKKLGGNAL